MPDVILVKSESMDDWFVIERAEHEHRGWMEDVDDGDFHYAAYRWSGRISDADVEGTAAEMLAIADAIERGESVHFRRCAALVRPDGGYQLNSPRNSQRYGNITAEEAKRLVISIREVAGAAKPAEVVKS